MLAYSPDPTPFSLECRRPLVFPGWPTPFTASHRRRPGWYGILTGTARSAHCIRATPMRTWFAGVRRWRLQRRLDLLGMPLFGNTQLCFSSLMRTLVQLTDWLAHVPKDVIAKNFQTSLSAFDHIPAQQLYIFPSSELSPYNLSSPRTYAKSESTSASAL